MVDIGIANGVVTFRVLGLHKLWALRSKVRVPIRDIVQVEPGETAAREAGVGWRLPGMCLPGLITAGSYVKSGQWSFWDVVRPAKTIAVTLNDHRFTHVIVEVADPTAELLRLREALAAAS